MAIAFREVTHAPLSGFTASAPAGAIIGILGAEDCGAAMMLRLAAGVERPATGSVTGPAIRRLLTAADPLDFPACELLAVDHAFARHDALARAQGMLSLERLRRGGATVLLGSHDEHLLATMADEIWWLDEGHLAAKGDPREVLESYRRHVARRFREWGEWKSAPFHPSLRRGDGRAQLTGIETLDASGRPAMVWQSGEEVSVRVGVRFDSPVEDPVVGIMIRTRIGFEVFGTNSELEQVKLGPCRAGDSLSVVFRFRCELCPQEYTLTAASHDPDGVWHDWVEDAVAFAVTDRRYTAGVANLRAQVTVNR